VVCWDGTAERVPVHDSVTVDRARFDAVLLHQAEAAGATVRSPVGAGRPVRDDGGWRIPVEQRALRARVVADASGRHRLLGGHRGWTGPRTLAVHARWPGSWPEDAPQTVVDTLPEGWLWAARLPGDDVRVIAFVDPQELRSEAGGPAHLLHRLVHSSTLPGHHVATHGCPGPVEVCDASSYVVDPPIGPDHVRVGEASFGIDPLSSSGVQTAIQSGLAAAVAVHTLLTPGGDVAATLEYYAELQRRCVVHHQQTAARFYAAHHRFARESFWQRRSSGAPPGPPSSPPPVPWTALLAHRVRLRAPAVLRDVPCLVGDLVVRRPALHHPDLYRPVAFLAGVELAPLLRDLPAAPSLATALQQWDHALPPGRGAEIVGWLHRRALLEPAP
jgi:hypothetical protein